MCVHGCVRVKPKAKETLAVVSQDLSTYLHFPWDHGLFWEGDSRD